MCTKCVPCTVLGTTQSKEPVTLPAWSLHCSTGDGECANQYILGHWVMNAVMKGKQVKRELLELEGGQNCSFISRSVEVRMLY